jgi:hypothetical protein
MRKILLEHNSELTYWSSEATATSSSLSELESTIVTGLIAFLRWLRRGITKVGWRENQILKTCEDKIKNVSVFIQNFNLSNRGQSALKRERTKEEIR